jgi:hypothetical protein
MSARRKNKVLETEVVKLCKRLETTTYELIDRWKKKYKYNLIESFRRHVENLRESTICALRHDVNDKKQKLAYYNLSLCSLDNIEYLLELMVGNRFQIINNREYADFAIMIDDIGIMVDRLIHSLNKSLSNKTEIKVADSQSYDNERDQTI